MLYGKRNGCCLQVTQSPHDWYSWGLCYTLKGVVVHEENIYPTVFANGVDRECFGSGESGGVVGLAGPGGEGEPAGTPGKIAWN